MADDGQRKLILNGVVTQIETAAGAPDYFYDYSSGVIELTKETLQTRMGRTRDVAINVQDGPENTTRKMREANVVMDVELHVLVKAQPAVLVAALQNVFADISRVLGKLPDLGVECTSTLIVGIEKPYYDFTDRYATAIMHLRAGYDYVPGVST